jgi:hypothetical protein
MTLPSVSLGSFLCSIGKKTGVLAPEKRTHPPGGHAVFYIFTGITLHYKESNSPGKYILKEMFYLEKFVFRGGGFGGSVERMRG